MIQQPSRATLAVENTGNAHNLSWIATSLSESAQFSDASFSLQVSLLYLKRWECKSLIIQNIPVKRGCRLLSPSRSVLFVPWLHGCWLIQFRFGNQFKSLLLLSNWGCLCRPQVWLFRSYLLNYMFNIVSHLFTAFIHYRVLYCKTWLLFLLIRMCVQYREGVCLAVK